MNGLKTPGSVAKNMLEMSNVIKKIQWFHAYMLNRCLDQWSLAWQPSCLLIKTLLDISQICLKKNPVVSCLKIVNTILISGHPYKY